MAPALRWRSAGLRRQPRCAMRANWPWATTPPRGYSAGCGRRAEASRDLFGRCQHWSCPLTGSNFLGWILHLEFELPSFERHQHLAELLPAHLATVDDQHGDVIVRVEVATDSRTHDLVRDRATHQIIVHQVPQRERAAHAFDQPRHEL